MMKERCIKRGLFGIWLLLIFAWLMVNGGEGGAADGPDIEKQALIIIDPGHGGYDEGARGAGGSTEKKVALEFAKILKKYLAPHYRVKLTRSGDYQVSLKKRASMANHQSADLFISIHSAGFYRSGISRWEIYYFAAHEPSFRVYQKAEDMSATGDRLNWHQIQKKYVQASQIVAGTLKLNLEKCPGIDSVKTSAAPLLLLEGLDMPAVMIEAGYLTHPACESQLNDLDFLANAAGWVHRGIDTFFTENE